ncbi:hypothetical protein [Cellulomonas sp. URHD0024]|uniref:hypothetical protein n=1 Tax=Cellulomonas sp. URHD0024 TaxID=1302620 RepID=UPI0004853EBF|nr:hypothetical protein [Cellulomonas sp. URHD0024]
MPGAPAGNRFTIGPPTSVAGVPSHGPSTPTVVPPTPASHSIRPVPVVLEPGPAAPRTAPRPAPERTIGVRVEAGAARLAPRAPDDESAQGGPGQRPGPFDAIQPDDVDQYAGADGPTGGMSASGDGEPQLGDAIRCPVCRRALPSSRRFCRCGATLVRPVVVEEEVERARLPWYRRLDDRIRRNQAFWRRMRSANAGIRAHYDRVRSVRVYAAQLTAMLAAVGITGVVLLPSAAAVREQAVAQATSLDPRGYTVLQATASTVPAQAADPQYAPAFAVDGKTATAWGGTWTQPTTSGGACGQAGGTATLVLTLPAPTDVDRISILGGMPATSPDRDLQDKPGVVDIVWGDRPDQCTEVTMVDSSAPQPFTLDAKDVTKVAVVIVGTIAPQNPSPTRVVAVSEVQLQRRGLVAVVPAVPVPSSLPSTIPTAVPTG